MGERKCAGLRRFSMCIVYVNICTARHKNTNVCTRCSLNKLRYISNHRQHCQSDRDRALMLNRNNVTGAQSVSQSHVCVCVRARVCVCVGTTYVQRNKGYISQEIRVQCASARAMGKTNELIYPADFAANSSSSSSTTSQTCSMITCNMYFTHTHTIAHNSAQHGGGVFVGTVDTGFLLSVRACVCVSVSVQSAFFRCRVQTGIIYCSWWVRRAGYDADADDDVRPNEHQRG